MVHGSRSLGSRILEGIYNFAAFWNELKNKNQEDLMSLRGRRHDGGGQNELIFFYTGNASATCDPTITTSQSTDVYWAPDDGPVVKTTGTTHAFSYVPGAGNRRCKVTVVGGLKLVTSLDCNTDAITFIKNISKCPLVSFYGYSNASMSNPLSDFSRVSGNLWLSGNTACAGNVASLNRAITSFRIPSTPQIIGLLSDLPRTIVGEVRMEASALSGPLDGLPPGIQYLYLHTSPGVTGGSIAHITGIRDVRLLNMAWNQETVDGVIDYLYQAVVADANHFTYAGPMALQIGGTNAAPSGIYQYAATPSTGLEKVYFLNHLAAHAWAIVYNGGP